MRARSACGVSFFPCLFSPRDPGRVSSKSHFADGQEFVEGRMRLMDV